MSAPSPFLTSFLSTSISSSSDVSTNSITLTKTCSEDPPTIHTLTACLHRIHAMEATMSKEQSELLIEALGLVDLLKENQLRQMPYSVRQRALILWQSSLSCSSSSGGLSSDDFVLLFGRCFNLSMNIKILNQCHYADHQIATRLLTDFQVISAGIRAKLHELQCNESLALLSL